MMIKTLTYVDAKGTSPYENLAMEEYLLFHCLEDEYILYLWQNQNTIVIGKNQNAWKECFVSRLEDDNGCLVRRLSGGGAVYHDLGNLNFTFITRREHYDVKRQTQIIIKALEKLGVQATSSGRNDILIDGKKISGNAYFKQGDFCYQHGTLMIDVDVDKLSRYLNVPEDKLKSKGIKSVRSRVGNIKDYLPDLTIEEMKQKLVEAFEEEFEMKAFPPAKTRMKQDEIDELKTKYTSWEWIYGRKFEFQQEFSHRFPWGGLTFQLNVSDGKIEDVEVFSDAMFTAFLVSVKEQLKGTIYSKKDICRALSLCEALETEEEDILKDIVSWMEKEDL